MTREALDIDFVRRCFPALDAPDTAGVAFFENAGGSYVPASVVERMRAFLVESKVQPYAAHRQSQRATEAIEQATVRLSQLFNAGDDEVLIGHSTTLNLYMLAAGLRGWLRRGDEVIVTDQDHEANISPWRSLSREGVVVREWRLRPESAALEVEDLQRLVGDRTRLVCVTHSSNILAQVMPLEQIAAIVHEAGALLVADGVSYAPHHAVDVKALGVDVYTASLYKLFGPHLGLMYVAREHHDKLDNQSFQHLPALYRRIQRPGSPNYLRIALNPGLVNHESVAAAAGIADYIDALYRHHFHDAEADAWLRTRQVFGLIETHESALATHWTGWLREQGTLTSLGGDAAETDVRSPLWSLLSRTESPAALAQRLADRDIAVQSGSFYAWRCLQALGIDPVQGVLRVSLAHFNTIPEIDRLIEALRDV